MVDGLCSWCVEELLLTPAELGRARSEGGLAPEAVEVLRAALEVEA